MLFGPVAQLVRAPPCHGGGQGFEPPSGRLHVYGILAQLGEHLPYKQRVTGSSPARGAGDLTRCTALISHYETQ